MSILRSTFASSTQSDSSCLGASLRFLTADTREGVTAEAAEDLAVIKAHAAGNPQRMAYVARFEQTAVPPKARFAAIASKRL